MYYSEKDLKDLSYNILLMLQETNKFREHQSRELLIELLEDQLQQRLQLIDDLEQKTELASSLLSIWLNEWLLIRTKQTEQTS